MEPDTGGWTERSSNCTNPLVIAIRSTDTLGRTDPAKLVFEASARRRMLPSLCPIRAFFSGAFDSAGGAETGVAVSAVLVAGVFSTARKFKVWFVSRATRADGSR